MSKQMLVIVGVLAATFGAGLVIGVVLSSDPSRSDSAPKASPTGSASGFYADAAAQDRVQNNTLLCARIRELEKELGDARQNQHAALTDRMAFFKKFHNAFYMPTVSADGKVTDQMVALLNLTPEETRAIEQHIAETKADLDKLQDADTHLTKQTDTSVSYEIDPDKQGTALKTKLTGILDGDIGQDRAEFFSSTESLASQMDGFLESKKQVEISWTQVKNQRTYTIHQSYFDASGASTGGNSITFNGILQPEFQKYLPDGMKP